MPMDNKRVPFSDYYCGRGLGVFAKLRFFNNSQAVMGSYKFAQI